MEEKKPGTSSSSIVEEIFGRKDRSSSEIFGFSTPSSAPGRDSSRFEHFGSSRKQEADKTWNNQKATADGNYHVSPSKGQSTPCKLKNSDYQCETMTPCHLSSSLYYGGQDIYCNYPSAQTSGTQYTNAQYKKDGEDDQDNSNLASRGNWWQGSLYY